MSIRIIDQSPDHSAQNPPPEDSMGFVQGEVRVVVAVSTPDGHMCVLRGDSSGNGLEAMTFGIADAPRIAEYTAGATPVGPQEMIDMPALGWQMRATGGSFKVGTGLERTVCKVAARWALTALAAVTRQARQDRLNQGSEATATAANR